LGGEIEKATGIKTLTISFSYPPATLRHFQEMGDGLVLLVEFIDFANDSPHMIGGNIFILF
jgi:hypothetical protein